MKLNLGCGGNHLNGYINVDYYDDSCCDVRHNLDEFPYPWGDKSIDEILAYSVFHSLKDIVGAMKELHRILKPNGILKIKVPHCKSANAWNDPICGRAFSYMFFLYFSRGHKIYNYKSYGFAFSSVKIRFKFGMKNPLNWIISPIANKFPRLYESTVLSAFPCMGMEVEMRK